MSRKHRARNNPTSDPVVDQPAVVDECEHVDDNNDGTCDLCGVEVEVETTTDEDPAPEVMVPPPSNVAPKYYVREGVGCPYMNGKTYKPGDVMPLTEAEAPKWKKFVELR